MGILPLLIGAAAGGATYLYAKNKKASTGTAAVAGGVAGAGGAAATVAVSAIVATLWFPALIIGVPVGLAYMYGKSRGQKALPPGRE
jgi:hypothetical protein